MPCSSCKYWMRGGAEISDQIVQISEDDNGSCFSTDAKDSIIRTEQSDSFLSIQLIMGITSGLYTKHHFECKYYEDRK